MAVQKVSSELMLCDNSLYYEHNGFTQVVCKYVQSWHNLKKGV